MPQSRETKDIWLISGRVATSDDAQWPHIVLMIATISAYAEQSTQPPWSLGATLPERQSRSPIGFWRQSPPVSRYGYQGAIYTVG